MATSFDNKTFDDLVKQAISRLPQEIRRYLDNMLISVQPRPSAELLADLDLPEDADLFGVYMGVPLPERSVSEPPLYPDIIYLFQQPLEDYCRSPEELIEEIEITVVHEVAHFVGFGEDDLAALGYD